MKKKIITICSITVVIILLLMAVLLGIYLPKKNNGGKPNTPPWDGNEGGSTPPIVTSYSVKQNLNYNESIEKINNPDQGFYYPFIVSIGPDGKITSQDYVLNDEASKDYQLYNMRVDISEFSKAVNGNKDLELTTAALDFLREELNLLKSKEKNIIIRFSYNKSYNETLFNYSEPEFEMLLKHVEQICSVLNDFEDTITAIEAGMIGKWGEMTDGTTSNYVSSTYYTPLIETFLNNTKNLILLVRTPQMIYDYIGITNKQVLLNEKITLNEKTKRLGLYDDSYLYNSNDSGTFTPIDSIDGIPGTAWNTVRYVHGEFLSQFTANSAFGGEALFPAGVHGELKNCIPEMFVLHTSYINGIYDSRLTDKWKSEIYNAESMQEVALDSLYDGQTGFRYIENHLGYRLVLTNSVFNYTSNYDNLTIKLNIKNVGFNNFNKTKNLKLMFVKEDGTVAYQNVVGTYNGEAELNLSTNINLQNGNYKVYLCVYSGDINNPAYCVQFANQGNGWSDNYKANLVGNFVVNK